MNTQQLNHIASQVRRDIVRMVHGVASGHPGGSLGCADFLTALYFSVMQHTPQPFLMDAAEQDIFILSNGHISPVLYSVLARSGYFPVSELSTFRRLNSRLQGHPATEEGLPGVRIATGSLGQGLSVAIGAALAKRQNNDSRWVFSLHGDGELQEGQIWEAAMFAAHHKIDNLIATVDWNGQQIDGSNDEIMSLGNLAAKWKAFGWHVLHVDGHEIDLIIRKIKNVQLRGSNGRPVVILMKTIMGKGVDFMEGSHEWHGIAPNNEQLQRALAQLPETLGDY